MRGWAAIVYGGKVPESSIRRKKLEFKLMVVGFYVMALVIGIAQHKF